METYFSVYKIDDDLVWQDLMKKGNQEKDLTKICKRVIALVKAKGARTESKKVFTSDDEKSFLLIFSNKNDPQWLAPILRGFDGTDFKRASFINQRSSFLLLKIVGTSIYASTGGSASPYIKDVIEKSFGLNLIPKLFDNSDDVLQEFTENHMVGARQSSSATNRTFTNFKNETDYSNIYRRISAKAGATIAKRLNLDLDEESDDKTWNVISSDALNFRKRMTLLEFYDFLEKVDSINNEPPNFALNYFVSAPSLGLSITEVREKMCVDYIEEKGNTFIVVGENLVDYKSSDKWEIEYDGEKKEFKDPITWEDVMVLHKSTAKRKLSKTSLKKVLTKWQISTFDANGDLKMKSDIINLVEYSFTDEFEYTVNIDEKTKIKAELPVYLSNGEFYLLNKDYMTFVDTEYENLKLESDVHLRDLYLNNDLVRAEFFENESKYNDSFMQGPENVIRTDKIRENNIELSDLIVFSPDKTYLICNKNIPNGDGARDLLNQIQASDTIIKNNPQVLKNYYNKLSDNRELKMSEDEFIKRLESPIYVGAYISEDLEGVDSNYAKILSIQTKDFLHRLNYEYFVTSPQRYKESSEQVGEEE